MTINPFDLKSALLAKLGQELSAAGITVLESYLVSFARKAQDFGYEH